MKYTEYLINKNIIDFKVLETENEIIKPITASLSIAIAVSGICIMSGMLPLTVMYDGFRILRYQYCLYNRKHNNKTFINISIDNCRYWWYVSNGCETEYKSQFDNDTLHKMVTDNFDNHNIPNEIYIEEKNEKLILDEIMLN